MGLTLTLGKRLNDLTKAAKTHVDGFQLEQMLGPHGIILVDLLASGQIAQIQLPPHQHPFRIGSVGLNQQLENRVRAGRVDVRACLSGNTRGFAPFEKCEAIGCVRYCILRLAFDENSGVLVFANVQRSLTVPVL